jgi:hypothetical protein
MIAKCSTRVETLQGEVFRLYFCPFLIEMRPSVRSDLRFLVAFKNNTGLNNAIGMSGLHNPPPFYIQLYRQNMECWHDQSRSVLRLRDWQIPSSQQDGATCGKPNTRSQSSIIKS